jgi:uncharacterized lipoprotein
MRLRFGYLFSCLLLAACASEDPRYRDTTALEKPPTLVTEKQEASAEAENAEADKLPEDAATDSDEDQDDEPKSKKGLGDRVVSISETPQVVLTIQQSYDLSWNSLKQALIQSGIEVTDLEHDKGKYYVSYDADSYVSEHGSLIEKSLGLFSDDYAKQAYVLTVSSEGSSTKVTAAPGKDAELRKRTDHDDEAADDTDAVEAGQPADGADRLLRSIYLTLKNDLREN